jgi:hypothetical protein
MLRWISAVLHEPGGAEAVTTSGGGHDIRWGSIWVVPLLAAVLALSAYPYFVTHRVDASVHALTSPAAAESSR